MKLRNSYPFHNNPPYQDRNVYIVGAGFSKEFDLPVVSDFLNRMRDSRAWLHQQSRETELEAVDSLFEFRLAASSAAERIRVNLENIEELFSLASASLEVSSSAVHAIAATLDYSETVAQKPRERIAVRKGRRVPSTWTLERAPGDTAVYTCPLMELFMLTLFGLPEDRAEGRDDTFITFNYDTMPEDALHSLGIPFTYAIPYARDAVDIEESARCTRPSVESLASVLYNGIKILKLHGSVNWADDGAKIAIHGTYEDVRRKRKAPMLLPPTWQKNMGHPLLVVWSQAVLALRMATNVVVIGYSMPPADQHFKYLLAAGLQGNISLRRILFVNPAPDEASIFKVLRADLKAQHVVEIIHGTAREFVLAGGQRVNRARPEFLRG